MGAKQSEAIRRESILAAAETVAFGAGIEAVNARSVAAVAGLSHALVYFYFDTKDGLLRGLLDRVMATTLDGPEVGFGEELSPEAAFSAMLESELLDLERQRDSLFLLFQFYFFRQDPQFRDPINEGMRGYEAAMAPVIERLANSLDARGGALRDFVMALIQGAVVDLVRRPETFDARSVLEAVHVLTQLQRTPPDALKPATSPGRG